jgi:hypothetical protein
VPVRERPVLWISAGVSNPTSEQLVKRRGSRSEATGDNAVTRR